MPALEQDSQATTTLDASTAHTLVADALVRCGASQRVADSVAAACVDAQAESQASTGFGAATDYCDALLGGRVNGTVSHVMNRPTPVVFSVDAKLGFSHPAFDSEYGELVKAATEYGVCLFSLRDGYASGALGYYAHRLATRGLVAIVTANAGPAVTAPSGGHKPVFCTNPIAFGVPRSSGYPLVIDQSTTQTSLANLRVAAAAGEAIPLGWALDEQGQPTTDAKRALEGVLLAFGGERGANIALMVEMMAAGLTGSNWSVDAASFLVGDKSPRAGLFIVAVNPALCGEANLAERAQAYLSRLKSDFGAYVPGERRGQNKAHSDRLGVSVTRAAIARLESYPHPETP